MRNRTFVCYLFRLFIYNLISNYGKILEMVNRKKLNKKDVMTSVLNNFLHVLFPFHNIKPSFLL